MEYEIKRCPAPCVGLIGREEYLRLVRDAVTFLQGGERDLIAELRRRMAAEAERCRFEEAARIRDTIAAIETTLEKQRVASMSGKDEDVFGLYREGKLTRICAIHIRKGRLVGRKVFPAIRSGMDPGDVLSALLKQYYDDDVFLPGEILVPGGIEDRAVMEDWLTERRGGRVRILTPARGAKKALLEMASSNARHVVEAEKAAGDHPDQAAQVLKRLLHLKNTPQRVEQFDLPDAGADDYAALYEALVPRFRGKENLPDLVVLEGGKGQLDVAVKVFKELGIEGVDVIGLAGEGQGTAAGGKKKKDGRVYIPGRKNPVSLSRHPGALRFLRQDRH